MTACLAGAAWLVCNWKGCDEKVHGVDVLLDERGPTPVLPPGWSLVPAHRYRHHCPRHTLEAKQASSAWHVSHNPVGPITGGG